MNSGLRPTWVFFGDSITQQGSGPSGWVSCVQDAYQRKVDVVNRGYSGYNTRMAKLVLPHIFPRTFGAEGGAGVEHVQAPPDLACVFFGANDAALPDRTSAKQHVALDTYVNNLKSMVTYLKREVGVKTVVLLAPPPVSEPHRLIHAKKTYDIDLEASERTSEVTGAYAAACVAVAQELGVPCVDLFSVFNAVEGFGDVLKGIVWSFRAS
jgi:lysophospholipase L1-like esterase